MASDCPAGIASETSSKMVKRPSGLVTSLVSSSAFNTAVAPEFMRAKLLVVASTVFWLCVAAAFADTAAKREQVILVMGDSLSAGYGINIKQGWVTLLEQRLKSQGYGYRVVNASVSGETSG